MIANNIPTRPPAARRPRFAPMRWLPLILLTIGPNVALGTSGGSQTVPVLPNGTPTFSVQSGLQITVDTSWAGDRGYRPVKITVSRSKPASAETLLTIKLDAGSWHRNQQSVVVERNFELPQGATTSTATLLVPQYADWNVVGWEVWVDGKKDEYLSLEQSGFSSPSNAEFAAVVLPDVIKAWGAPNYLQQAVDGTLDVHSPAAAELPDSWIGYSGLDVLTANPESLQRFRNSSAERFAELLRWVRAGGNLWVYDVGRDYARLDDVQATLGLPTAKDSSRLLQRGWQILPLSDKQLSATDALVELTGMTAELHEPARENTWQADPENPDEATDSERWFVSRALGMGTITVFQDPYGRPVDANYGGRRPIERSLLAKRLHWATRHGNDPSAGNPHFNDWLIPDVGHAPVLQFQLLISLFVLGIGPLNYWVLKRRDQLPLLLVTVPVAAVATTLLLFAYGFLADGFGVKVRARSLTMLDQRAGEAACWTRLSYYAGIAPSEGLQMPTDTVVYPIAPPRSRRTGFTRRYTAQQREMVLDGEQHLTRGWLGSRTPTQYLSVTARPSSKRIRLQQQDDRLVATNELGVNVVALVVEDHDGKIHIGESIDVGATSQLATSDRIKALMLLRGLLSDNAPQFPAGYQPNRRNWRGDGYESPLPDNLMESQIAAIISPIAESLGKGTYVAITDQGVEVSLGLTGAVEMSSFHVIRGIW